MFSVYGSLEGNASKLEPIECSQLLKVLQYPIFKLPKGDLVISNSELSEADSDNPVKFAPVCSTIMDQTGRKKYEKSFVPMPDFLVNNPNISIIPATNSNTSPKQHPVPVSRVSRIVTGPVKAVTGSAPVKAVPVSTFVNNLDQLTKKCADSIETKNGTKRISSQTPDRGAKKPRISNTKPIPKPSRDKLVDSKLSEQISKLSAIEINQIIKFDSPSKLPNTNTNVATSSSTSSSASKVQDSSFKPSQTNSVNINSKVDSANIDAEKVINGTLTKYQFSSDGQFKMNQVYSEEISDSSPSKGQVLEIRTRNTPNDECFTIERTELISHILTIVKSAVKSHVPEENYDTFIQSTKVVQSPEHNRLPETKSISPNLKLNTANHNNITTPTHPNSKHQSTSKVDVSVKSPRTSNPPQKSSPKPAATIQVLTSPKQASTSINSTSKTTNQSDIKHQVTSNQHCTPLKHSMATVTQIQSSNKQINKNQQLKTVSTKVVSVTHVPSVSKRMQVNDKPTITCQSSLQIVKKCIKCNVLSDDDVCTTCLMSSQLKGVTVTRIETPGTESTDIIDLDSDKDSDEEETNFSLITEPTITRVETKDQLKKHIEKLIINPNVLEDKLWQKDLSTKDFFKFDQCHTVQIGSFTTSPVPSGDMIICVYGIRMTVNNTSSKATTIDIPTENIVKIYGNYADEPTLIIYTNYLAAFGIQYLMNMNEKDKNCYYDPVSKDDEQKKIILSFDIRKQDVSHLEKLLMKLNGKYEVLTQAAIRSISLRKSLNREKTDKKLQAELSDDTVIVRDTLEGRKVAIRVADYKMLTIDEYLNDILIEFHLNRTYMLNLTPENKNQSYVFNTYFYTTLTRKTPTDLPTTESKSKIRHDRVKKWTKNVNIFEKNFIFVPINESCHWYMIVICFPHLTGPVYMDDGTPVKTPVDDINYFENRDFNPPGPDAMKSDCDEADGYVENLRHIDPYYYEKIGESYEEDVENLLQSNYRPIKQPCILVFDSLYGNTHNCCRAKNVATIREWLAEEYRAKYNGAERDFSINVVKGHTVKVPQQTNYTDCGLFVLHFFEKFFKCPIVDYRLPILHLANWFLPDEVQLNCKKRKDVATMIQNLFHEQNLLPPGTVLPTLKFTPREPPQVIQHPNPIESLYDDSHDLENSECGDESHDEYLDEEEYDESENYNSLNQCGTYSGEEDDYDSQDGNVYDYYPEMDAAGNRINISSDADYVHSELYDMEQYDNMNPLHENVVNVDDSLNGSISQRNHQHISNTNYGLYNQNNRIHSHNDDEEDVEEEDDYSVEGDYDEDDEPSQSANYSNRHNRHFKRRRLSNE